MKVLMVIAPVSFGGGEALMINLLKELKTEIRIEIALIYSSERFEHELDKMAIRHYELSKNNIGHGEPKIHAFLRVFWNFVQIPLLGKIIRENQYDIVQANGFPAVFMVYFLKKHCKFRSIYMHHSIRSYPSKIEQIIFGSWYNSYDVCTAVSQTACNSMNTGFPKNKKKFITVYNCIAEYFFSPLKTENALFGHDKINFVQVARFTDVKNQECIVCAVEKLSEDIRNKIRIIFVGDGYERERIETMIENKGLQGIFLFVGAKEPEEIPAILDACDFGLMPSKAEGFGLAAVECMARGLPVIASDIPVFREIVGDTGYIKAFNNMDEAFKEALLDGSKKRTAAMEKASKFKPKIIKEEYMRLYESVMDGRPYEKENRK